MLSNSLISIETILLTIVREEDVVDVIHTQASSFSQPTASVRNDYHSSTVPASSGATCVPLRTFPVSPLNYLLAAEVIERPQVSCMPSIFCTKASNSQFLTVIARMCLLVHE